VTSGISPAELFLGRQLRCKLDLVRPQEKEEGRVEDREQDLTSERKNCIKSFTLNGAVFWSEYKNGAVVWRPGRIVKRLGRNVWKIEDNNGKILKKHADQLKCRHLDK